MILHCTLKEGVWEATRHHWTIRGSLNECRSLGHVQHYWCGESFNTCHQLLIQRFEMKHDSKKITFRDDMVVALLYRRSERWRLSYLLKLTLLFLIPSSYYALNVESFSALLNSLGTSLIIDSCRESQVEITCANFTYTSFIGFQIILSYLSWTANVHTWNKISFMIIQFSYPWHFQKTIMNEIT